MLDLLFGAIAALGSTEAQNIISSAGENAVKSLKDTRSWKKVLIGTGEFFVKHEQDQTQFFKDLSIVLSKENLSQIAKDLKSEDGYELKHRLYSSLMQLMRKFEIPYEIAESYTMRIIYEVLEQLRVVAPEKYEHYFLQEWRDEQDRNLIELQNRIEKISTELKVYNSERISISSSGQMDIELRKSTKNPSIGIDFFCVDDEHFQDEFEDSRYEEFVFIRGRNREETIYCILNELWRLNDKRPIFVVKSLESWKKLQTMEVTGNVYIPWFYADEIVAIENNTTFFVLDENTPVFGKQVLELRPRTRSTLSKCLQDAGMNYEKAYSLLADTHGLYSQIKKQLFQGEYLKVPTWTKKISDKAKKTCLLIGSWEEIDGDKLIIESLYEDSYDNFISEVLPYVKGEDPLLYLIKRNGSVSYYLASAENIWSYFDILTTERIWKLFVNAVLEVLNESENLFTYDHRERLVAQFKGEQLFWSETIRKGMLNSLLIKGVYYNDEETKLALCKLVDGILECVKTEKQWIYISRFWRELCEISPGSVLSRLENELSIDTGLMSLFQNQSSDFILGRNAYIDILWGIEQLICQKEFFWRAYRWLLQLDSKDYDYKSNSPKDIFAKIYCTWVNFSPLVTADQKIDAAEIAIDVDCNNAWEYLYNAINGNGRSIFGDLSTPKYREHFKVKPTTVDEMQKSHLGYYKLLIKHMDFSVDRWKKMIDLSGDLSAELRKDFFEQLLYELSQMTDEEVMHIKNQIRHLIYKHRYFSSSEWSMSEEILQEYESLLTKIRINTPEYEYSYLFLSNDDYPLLHPIPYNPEERIDENERATDELINNKLNEFNQRALEISVLASVCSKEPNSSLGNCLAKYWNNGQWDYSIFKALLSVQSTGSIALDYLGGFNGKECIDYNTIIDELLECNVSTSVLSEVYRIEALNTKYIPLVTTAPESVKKEFWKRSIFCDECNKLWALGESKKYSNIDVYLDQVYRIHYRHSLSAEEILKCFEEIENMPHPSGNRMTSYHVEQLLMVMQEAFIEDADKCLRISHLEIIFMNLIEWENMRCFQHMIKKTPELLAQIIDVAFKKDHAPSDEQFKDQAYIHNMYSIYDKAHFCPCEDNGQVIEAQLSEWIEKYKQLLIENDQESLFTPTLGRLFSFSPLGMDGHEPCEAVRKMIEKYGDGKMQSRYQTAVYNRRGIFSPSAGKEELKMAEDFKTNAEYLEPHYPKTAKIFYGLYETYKRESERERMDAENGWY